MQLEARRCVRGLCPSRSKLPFQDFRLLSWFAEGHCIGIVNAMSYVIQIQRRLGHASTERLLVIVQLPSTAHIPRRGLRGRGLLCCFEFDYQLLFLSQDTLGEICIWLNFLSSSIDAQPR